MDQRYTTILRTSYKKRRHAREQALAIKTADFKKSIERLYHAVLVSISVSVQTVQQIPTC
jgi:hypothetical protein